MSASLPLSLRKFRLDDVLDWCKRKKLPHKSKSKYGIARAESAVRATEASIISNTQDGSKSEGGGQAAYN